MQPGLQGIRIRSVLLISHCAALGLLLSPPTLSLEQRSLLPQSQGIFPTHDFSVTARYWTLGMRARMLDSQLLVHGERTLAGHVGKRSSVD